MNLYNSHKLKQGNHNNVLCNIRIIPSWIFGKSRLVKRWWRDVTCENCWRTEEGKIAQRKLFIEHIEVYRKKPIRVIGEDDQNVISMMKECYKSGKPMYGQVDKQGKLHIEPLDREKEHN